PAAPRAGQGAPPPPSAGAPPPRLLHRYRNRELSGKLHEPNLEDFSAGPRAGPQSAIMAAGISAVGPRAAARETHMTRQLAPTPPAPPKGCPVTGSTRQALARRGRGARQAGLLSPRGRSGAFHVRPRVAWWRADT